MEMDDLIQAIGECDNGDIAFNRGNKTSFLYSNKWYPLLPVVNRALVLAGEVGNVNTHRAAFKLCLLGMWVRIENVLYHVNLPIEIAHQEAIEELVELGNIIDGLNNA